MHFCYKEHLLVSLLALSKVSNVLSQLGAPLKEPVVCPGMGPDDFCDCSADCSDKTETSPCLCDAAIKCCKSRNKFWWYKVGTQNDYGSFSYDYQEHIVCPGKDLYDYCDCSGDCSDKTETSNCLCDAAIECCKSRNKYWWYKVGSQNDYGSFSYDYKEHVVCPGKDLYDYCDCSGDCSDKTETSNCLCDAAQECCEGSKKPENTESPTESPTAFENVALKGAAAMSCALWHDTPASKAIDGSTDGNGRPKFACTCKMNKAWWQVTLDSEYTIYRIIVWNRSDVNNSTGCCRDRLSYAELKVYESSTLVDTNSFGDMSQSIKKQFDYPGGITGDIVKVQLTDEDYLHIAEVQVFVKVD